MAGPKPPPSKKTYTPAPQKQAPLRAAAPATSRKKTGLPKNTSNPPIAGQKAPALRAAAPFGSGKPGAAAVASLRDIISRGTATYLGR